jgi:6-phosphofructokinase 2
MAARIVTLTLNPAVDIACMAESVRHTHKVRTRDERVDAGGGGINVAQVLHTLGDTPLAVILAGGVTGALIEEMLDDARVPARIIPTKGRTRLAFTVYDKAAGVEYRFVPEGPLAEEKDWLKVLSILEAIEADWLVASGSVGRGVPSDIYAQIAIMARRRGLSMVLDASGPPLAAALSAGVDLIKPSLTELETLVGRGPLDDAQQEAEAMALVRSGQARLVAVTLGEFGAFLASAEGIVRMPGLSVPVRSAVGAGDSFLAALTLALARGESKREALKWGVAAGTAAVLCTGTARLTRAEVENQYSRLSNPLEDCARTNS